MVASTGGQHLTGLVDPRGPDVTRLVATALEMEACRLIYQQSYALVQDDPIIRVAGNVGDLFKTPASRFGNESWRISNNLNATAPLCGEVRFGGFRRPSFLASPATDTAGVMASDLSTFAHEETTDLFERAKLVAVRAVPMFYGTVSPVGADISNDIATLEDMIRKKLDSEKVTINGAGQQIAANSLRESVDAGWLAAARFILEIVRLQQSTSDIFNHALPSGQEPVLAHPALARQLLVEALDTLPSFHSLDQEGFGKLATFYGQNSRVMAQVHNWMYSSQIPEKDFVAPSVFDIRDKMNAATEPETAFALYGLALDGAALERGVWGENPDMIDSGYPFAQSYANSTTNPLAALVEFGQRQLDLSFAISGLAGTGLASTGTAGAAVLLGAAAFALLLGGLLLVFIVPLLPFARLLMGVLAWIVNVFEAVVAMPVVALAHLTPSGEGLSGGLARQSYLLWLGLFIRPVLTVFGLVLGLLLFVLGLTFLNAVLTPFTHLAAPENEGLFVIANLALVLLYDVLVYIIANASFKGIYWLPDQAIRWLSNFTLTDTGGAVVAGAPGAPGPAGSSSFLSISGSAPASGVTIGSAVTNLPGTLGTARAASSPPGRTHAMKNALFPVYSDKTPSVTIPGASTSTQQTERMRSEKTTIVTPEKKKPKNPLDDKPEEAQRVKPVGDEEKPKEEEPDEKDSPEDETDDQKKKKDQETEE
jgi:conjugal transfer/type IV secretion protein DotA/TraY